MDLAQQWDTPQLSLLGTRALLFEAPGPLGLENQQRIWALADYANGLPELAESVPGMNNLMLVFTTLPAEPEQLFRQLLVQWARDERKTLQGKTVELSVFYGGELGPHLLDVAEHSGLSVSDVVACHSAPLYPVYALGSHPGYCYLGNMDPRIATPRRQTPLMSIPGGAVSIGGLQTGVSASAGPSGWNTIGHTDFIFFDAGARPPVTLLPGDNVVFKAVGVRA
ncbi:5-oxoprolinase subunit PxpB [Acerihabitans sp. TG2]|uniref:5-oxoprolinase subunit PxpB n=1 Tax=Acerihabitans sp. TG2 TaxID=3096008 RepID=UPI002B2371E5|nr:5-oxoprolinase subunit PxpB [Acerihabitans sp. TG2]MEA9389273.1 5-oxoprolinase subunit PxpB [Acerihabitans sp. TG2]